MPSTVIDVADQIPYETRVSFQRARRPEHKAERERQILDAARRLALERGVRTVTLSDIARSVRLTKSNVLRYFETREAIYLHLSATGYREWACRIHRAINTSPEGPIVAEKLATLLVDALEADPLFCDLLGDITSTLDHNVSVDAARIHKHASKAALEIIGAALADPRTGLVLNAARELTIATVMIAASAWPATHPPEILADLYRSDEQLAEFSIDFGTYLTRQVTVLIRGLVSESNPRL